MASEDNTAVARFIAVALAQIATCHLSIALSRAVLKDFQIETRMPCTPPTVLMAVLAPSICRTNHPEPVPLPFRLPRRSSLGRFEPMSQDPRVSHMTASRIANGFLPSARRFWGTVAAIWRIGLPESIKRANKAGSHLFLVGRVPQLKYTKDKSWYILSTGGLRKGNLGHGCHGDVCTRCARAHGTHVHVAGAVSWRRASFAAQAKAGRGFRVLGIPLGLVLPFLVVIL